MKIRKIDSTEVEVVHDLAHKIWPSTFAEILSSEQIAYMLNWMYNIETLKNQMVEGHEFFLAEEDEVALGFMGIQVNFPYDRSVKIHKLYVLPELQGKGIGRKFISEVLVVAKENGKDRIILNVNRFNKAVSFYQKLGFTILLEENIDIGNGYLMEDFVMTLPV
jgi:GNAT superfamily N-acetyltransferase